MKVRAEQTRDADRGRAGERDAATPIAVSAPSGDVVRDAIAALRAARRLARASAVDAAVEALSARASDPFGAVLDGPRLASEPRELDAKDDGDREDVEVANARGGPLGPLGRPGDRFPARPPETGLLAHGFMDELADPAAERAAAQANEAEDRDELPEATGEQAHDPPGIERARTGKHHPARVRDAEDARRSAHSRQQAIDKREKALAQAPRLKLPEKPRMGTPRATEPGAKKITTPPATPAPTKNVAGASGSSTNARAAAWHAKVVADTNAIKPALPPDSVRYVVEYQAATTAGSKQTAKQKIELIKTARDAVPPAPKFQDNGEHKIPDPDPLPDLRAKVLEQTTHTIKPQEMPELARSPMNKLPEIGTRVVTDHGKKHVLQEVGAWEKEIVVVPPGGTPPAVLKGYEAVVRTPTKLPEGKGTLAERVKAHNATDPKNAIGDKSPARRPTISNDMPKQAPKIPRLDDIPKIDTAAVIGRVLAKVDPASQDIVGKAQDALPGGSELPAGFSNVFVPQTKADLLKELGRLKPTVKSGADALKEKIDAEREKADAAAKANQEAVDEACKVAKKERYRFSDQVTDHIGGLLDDMDRYIADHEAVAKGGFDPKVIKAQQRAVEDANDNLIKTWLGNYETMRSNRATSIGDERRRQLDAYAARAELDKLDLDARQAGDKSKDKPAEDLTAKKTEIDNWLKDIQTDLPKAFKKLTDAVDLEVAGFVKSLKAAGLAYHNEISKWAKARLHMEKSVLRKVIDKIKDWLGIVEESKKTWEATSNTDNATTLANAELDLSQMIVTDTGIVTEKAIEERTDLSEAQKKMMRTYFLDTNKDGVAALAEFLIAELGVQWRPQLLRQIEAKVLNAEPAVIVAVANASGFDAEAHARTVMDGFKDAGTNKDKVFAGLKTKSGVMTKIQARALEIEYARINNGAALRADLNSELHDLGDIVAGVVPFSSDYADEDRALALLDAEPEAAEREIASQLDAMMNKTGWGTGLGVDSNGMLALMRGKTPVQRMRIADHYRELTGRDLEVDAQWKLTGPMTLPFAKDQWDALQRGDTDTADAIAMRRAHGLGTPGMGVNDWLDKKLFADFDVADKTYDDIRNDVASDAEAAAAAGHPWDKAEFERQVERRLGKLETRFGELFAWQFGNVPGKSALAVAHEMWGDNKTQILLGRLQNKFDMESSARVSDEHKTFFSSADKVNKAIEAQSLRAMEDEVRTLKNAEIKQQKEEWEATRVEPRSDSKADREAAQAQTIAKREAWRKKWFNREAREERKRDLLKQAQQNAIASGAANYDAMKAYYNTHFTTGGLFSTGSFEGDVVSATALVWNFDRNADNDKAYALMENKGYLTDDQQLLFGVKGAGTDDPAVQKAYQNKSPAEIAAMHARLQGRLTKIGVTESAQDYVRDDYSGSDLDDIMLAQWGDPITDRDKLAKEAFRVELQKQSVKRVSTGDWILGAVTMTDPRVFSALRQELSKDDFAYMDESLAKAHKALEALEAEKVRLDAAGIHEGDLRWYKAIAPFEQRVDMSFEAVRGAVASNRATLDAAVSWATVGIQVVIGIASLVAGILLTPVTGGTSIAIAIAVVGALATMAATVAAKAALKGSAYGWEEMAYDVAVGLVDAATAALTAGFGGPMIKALGLAKTATDSAVKAAIRTALRKTVGHFLTGAIQAAPSAFINAFAHGGGLMDALEGILQGGVMSVVLGNITDPITEHFQFKKAMAARLNPAEFDKALAGFQKEHPEITDAKKARSMLRAQLDEILLTENRRAFHSAEMQDQLRADLLAEVPADRRAGYQRAKIEMVDAATFQRAGGSPERPAIVTMKDGVPIVTMRAGSEYSIVGKGVPDLRPAARVAEAPAPPARAATTMATPVGHAPAVVAEPASVPRAPAIAAEAVPVPRGASASPDPYAPVAEGAPPRKLIVEPLAGPRLDSAVDLALRNPDASVIATERSIRPPASEVARLEKAGGTFIPENKTPRVAPDSVDEMKMRFPIPHERTAEQDWHLRFAEVQDSHPHLDRLAQYELASRMTADLAESLTAYAPYALERLKVGGTLEVVFHEPHIIAEVGDVSRIRFIDPATGKGYRLEPIDIAIRTRGEVAPHSGYGIPEMTHATEVRVVTFEKVELVSKLPTGARGADIAAGEVVGAFSGRRFTPSEAGGPIRELDFSKIKFTDRGVDVVEAHLRRFDGGGEMELAMVDRLRRIAKGELAPTDFDRAFYSHELRESVRYRQLGLAEGQPIDPATAYEIWNNAHTAALEDYRLNERLAGGRRALFHPDVVETPDLGPTGARGRPDVAWDTEMPLGVRHGDARAQAEGGRCATWVWVEVMRNAGWVGAVASDPGQIAGLVRTLRDPVTGERLPRIKGTPEELVAAARHLPPGSQIAISARTENDVWHALLGRVSSDGSLEVMHGPRGTPVGNDRIYFAERGDLARYTDHRWWVLPPIPEAPPHLRIGRPQSELVLRPPPRQGLAAGESLPPPARRMLEADLVKGGRPLEALRALSDAELVVAHRDLQVERAPLRLAELRETVGWQARGELDTLLSATHRMADAIDPAMAHSISKAFEAPVVPDPSLDPHEIRVVPRKGLLGGLGGVEVRYGPGARLGDVLLHGGQVLTGKKLSGLAGLARRVVLAVDRLIASGVYPPRGTRGAEALEEIHKLPGIIEQKRAQWGDAADPVQRYQLERQIETLEGQLRRHIGELADLSPGRGYIASEGVPDIEPPARSPVRRPLAEASDLRLAPLPPSSFPGEVQRVIKGSWVHEALQWSARELTGLPRGEYMYIARDAETGEVLKIGKTSHDGTRSSALDKRMGLYRNAAELTGRDVQIELHALTARDAEPFETAVRKQLYQEVKADLAKQGLTGAALEQEIGKTFRWDNMVDHRRKMFMGPGTPGESWTRKERVFVVSAEPASNGVKKIRVRHDDGHVQDIVTRKVTAKAGEPFMIPRDELYGWVRVPGDPRNPVFQRGGATGDAPLVKAPSKADVIAALPDAERRAALAALLHEHRAERADDVVKRAGAALGIGRTKMYEMLNSVDPPLQPPMYKPLP